MATPKSTTCANERCWVWFKGDPLKQDGSWKAGFYGAPSVLGGIRIESPDFVPCRVPEWRVLFKEPKNMKQTPNIPAGDWKLFPTEPK
tara:strand:+ start:1741 stop:2004 length:264 start_codon:yes stop_codon:yes gene_type:complete